MNTIENLMAKAANDNEIPENMELEDLVEWIRTQRNRRDKIVATTELTHSEAYNKAARKLLADEKNEIDYDRLDDPKTQLEFVREMTRHYLEAAKDYFNVDFDLEDLEKKDSLKGDMLLKAYAGVTKGTLRGLLSKHRSGYTKRKHDESSTTLVDQIKDQLTETIYSPIKGEHAEDVLKHTKSHDFLDHEKMERENVIGVLEAYFSQGTLSPKMFKGQLYLKDEHKKYKKAA